MISQFILPPGWQIPEISDILNDPKKDLVDGPFGSNLKSSDFIDAGIPVFKIQNIKANRFVNKKIDFVSASKAKELDRHSFRAGDLIITKLGDPLGLCCEVPPNYDYGIIVADLLRLRPNNFITSKEYLLYVINSAWVQEQFKEITKGTTRSRVNLGIVRSIKIPLPPLAEQHRIVAKIEELFSELEKGVESLKTARQQLKVYRKAVLKYAFEGKLTNPDARDGELPEGWVTKTFGDCTTNFDGKRIPLSKEVRSSRKGQYRYYGATEVVDFIDDFIFDGRYLLIGEDGANLLTKSKPLSHITNGKFWVNNHAHIVKSIDGILLDYLCHYINSLHLDQYVTGTAQPKLTKANLNKIPIDIPTSRLEQQKIIQEIESRLFVCDKIEESIEQSLQQAEALRQSILKKAFEGKLVPQDPNDEPASVLLERIKAERASAQSEKKTRAKKAKA